MSRLPTLRPRELVAALQRAGFVPRRQAGSHLTLKHPDGRRAVVPIHNNDLKRSTLHFILSEAGLSEGDLLDLL